MTNNAIKKPEPGPLRKAIEQNDVAAVKELLQHGADANEANEYGQGVLDLAADRGYTGIARLLIRKGANVNQKDQYRITPLMNAALMGRIETVRLLIDSGAKINAKNIDGTTALMQSATSMEEADSENKPGIARLLIENGARVNVTDYDGYTALKIAEENYDTEMVQLFKEASEIERRCRAEKARAAKMKREFRAVVADAHAIAAEKQQRLNARARPILRRSQP